MQTQLQCSCSVAKKKKNLTVSPLCAPTKEKCRVQAESIDDNGRVAVENSCGGVFKSKKKTGKKKKQKYKVDNNCLASRFFFLLFLAL